ncbi:hypothetical protein ACOMHN_011997 [Nucella lapillus]
MDVNRLPSEDKPEVSKTFSFMTVEEREKTQRTLPRKKDPQTGGTKSGLGSPETKSPGCKKSPEPKSPGCKIKSPETKSPECKRSPETKSPESISASDTSLTSYPPLKIPHRDRPHRSRRLSQPVPSSDPSTSKVKESSPSPEKPTANPPQRLKKASSTSPEKQKTPSPGKNFRLSTSPTRSFRFSPHSSERFSPERSTTHHHVVPRAGQFPSWRPRSDVKSSEGARPGIHLGAEEASCQSGQSTPGGERSRSESLKGLKVTLDFQEEGEGEESSQKERSPKSEVRKPSPRPSPRPGASGFPQPGLGSAVPQPPSRPRRTVMPPLLYWNESPQFSRKSFSVVRQPIASREELREALRISQQRREGTAVTVDENQSGSESPQPRELVAGGSGTQPPKKPEEEKKKKKPKPRQKGGKKMEGEEDDGSSDF